MKRSTKLAILFILAFLGASNWFTNGFWTAPKKREVKLDKVKLMTYNLENLFDNVDDPGKNDETYLPVSKKKTRKIKEKCQAARKSHWVKECLTTNWTDLKIQKKMSRLAKVINSYAPDVLFVQEVENISVLKTLNEKHLGFKEVILLEGEDKRGIDVGILTNLNLLKKPKIHSQKTKKFKKPTRGILEATFELPGEQEEQLTLYAVHLPSQGSNTQARENGLEVLRKIAAKKDGLKIVAGDFNITKKENYIYKKTLKDSFMVSHEIGCKKCKGTYYYHPRRAWSFFDVFLFSKSFKNNKNWKIDRSSIRAYNVLDMQNTKYNTPARFLDGEHKNGVSDHWPLVVEIIKI